VLAGIFDDDSQAGLANRLLRRAQNPYAGVLHLDLRIDALARA